MATEYERETVRESQFYTQAASDADAPVGKGKNLLYIIGTVFFIVVLVLAWLMFKPSAPVPAPAPAQPAKAAPATEAPPEEPVQAPVQPADQVPQVQHDAMGNPIDPSAVPAQQYDAMGNPIGAQAPVQQQPAVPAQQYDAMGNPIGAQAPVQQQPAVPAQQYDAMGNPIAAQGQAPVQVTVNPPVQQQPAVPAQQYDAMGNPVAAQGQAPVQVTVNPPVDPLAVPVADTQGSLSAIDQVRSDIMAGLDGLKATIADMGARFDERFNSLESRVAALESGRRPAASAPSSDGSGADRPASRPRAASKPASRRAVARRAPARKVAPRATGRNRVEIIPANGQGGDYASVPQPVREIPAARLPETSCRIKAIQGGRFWVQNDDGTFSTYSVGDRVSGGRVTAADERTGVYVNGKPWGCR